ncbi:MAG: glycosyltransferase [Candidatus Korarchaeota archaeon]|nr:glycosyltransferase [Candidatus Korarchaeota archaeon]
MKLSVVIPTYREASYIKRTLMALRNENVDEIVVIDGGSEDGTVEIAERYADIVRSSPEYDSPAKARNAGIRLSSGDMIAFVDADTVVAKGWRAALIKGFEEEEVIGLGGPAYPLEDGDDLLKAAYILSYDLMVRFTIFMGRPHLMGFNSAFRRDVLLRLGGFREDVRVSEDALLSMAASRMGKIKFVPGMVVYTSARRVRKRGLGESLFYLVYNGLSVLLMEKPFETYPKIT